MLWTSIWYSWAEMQMLNDSDWSGKYSWFGTHGMLSKQVVSGAPSLRKTKITLGLLFLGDWEFQQWNSPASQEAFPVAGTCLRALSHGGSLVFNNVKLCICCSFTGMFTRSFSFSQLLIFTTVGALNLSYMAESRQLNQTSFVGDGHVHMHSIIPYYSLCWGTSLIYIFLVTRGMYDCNSLW